MGGVEGYGDAVRSGVQAATLGEAGEDHNKRSLGDEGKGRGVSTVEAKTEVKTRGHEQESEHVHGLEQEGGGEGKHNRILRTDEEELSSKAKAKIPTSNFERTKRNSVQRRR